VRRAGWGLVLLAACGGAGGIDGATIDGGDAREDAGGADGGGGGGDAGDIDAGRPPGDDGPIGWAAVPGYDLDTTTGGGDVAPVVVSSAAAFDDAVGGDEARVIHVSGTIQGDFVIGSNKTIVGLAGARIVGSLALNQSENVILRDFIMQGHNCTDTDDCGDGLDAITMRGVHHVWVDHLDVFDGSDGNMDIIAGSDLVTVSWTKFSYSGERAPDTGNPHFLSNLLGSSAGSALDVGKLRVTFHHDWWGAYIQGRMPFVRYGQVHVFNNLYTSAGNNACVQPAFDADVLVEGNAFIGVEDPIQIHPDASAATRLVSRDNLFDGVTGEISADVGPGFTPPYDYPLDAADAVEAQVMAGAGPR
jgi:pectate lyase